MPKEITHWLIAQQVASALQGSRLGELVERFPNCMHLGAILHDAGYYARDRRWKDLMSDFTDRLHAEDPDTFTLINTLTEAANQSRNPGPIRAMIIGMLTHMATDSCFHPLIYHETGNYFDPDPAKRTQAVQKHRRFETILDVYLAGTMTQIKTFSLKNVMRCCELKVPLLLQEAFIKTADMFACPQLPNALLHCLTLFSRMQALYANPAVTNILECLHRFMPDAAREITALFYLPDTVKQVPGLHGQRNIPEPETGTMRSVTVLELYNDAIQSSLNLCRTLEPALMGTAPFAVPDPVCSPGIALSSNRQHGA